MQSEEGSETFNWYVYISVSCLDDELIYIEGGFGEIIPPIGTARIMSSLSPAFTSIRRESFSFSLVVGALRAYYQQ